MLVKIKKLFKSWMNRGEQLGLSVAPLDQHFDDNEIADLIGKVPPHYAAITREVLNADTMSLTIFCGGQSTVGIGLSGTWVGTASFYGSADGINFFAMSATPFASGTAVSSATANGNYFSPVKNLIAIKVVFTRTSGSLQVILAAAVDSSWQDAFLSASTIAVSSTTSGGNNTLTQAAQANRAWKCTFLEVSFAGVLIGAAPRIDVYDGTIAGTTLYTAFLTGTTGSIGIVQKINLPTDASGNPSLVNTPGNAMTVVVSGVPSVQQTSTINAQFTAA